MKVKQFIDLVIAMIGQEAYEESKKEIAMYSMFVSRSQSQNAKTGALTQTYSSKNSCPTNCPFKNCGCYARAGHCNVWFNVASGKAFNGKKMHIAINELKAKLGDILTTKTIRHNVAGDIARPGSGDINAALVAELMQQYKGHKVYTYTHCEKSPKNLEIIKAACAAGMVINASCENIEDVERARAAGCPAVLAVESMPNKKAVVNGVKYERCPATCGGKATCNNCLKCARANRDYVIVFPVHGTAENVSKVKNAGFLVKELI